MSWTPWAARNGQPSEQVQHNTALPVCAGRELHNTLWIYTSGAFSNHYLRLATIPGWNGCKARQVIVTVPASVSSMNPVGAEGSL